MRRGTLLGLATACLGLGAADLAVLNLALVPAAWPELGAARDGAAQVATPSPPEPERASQARATAPEPTARTTAPEPTPVASGSTATPQAPAAATARLAAEPTSADAPAATSEAAVAEPRPSAQPAAAPAATPTEPVAQTPQQPERLTSVVLLFSRGECRLSSQAQHVLDRLVQRLADHGDYAVRIDGHTDRSGAADRHGSLSLLRAKKAAEYLEAKGVERDRITCRAMGAAVPVDPGDTPQAQRKNRRVEIRVFRSKP